MVGNPNRYILDRAIEKGLLPQNMADRLIHQVQEQGRSLEEVLREIGLLSEQTIHNLLLQHPTLSTDDETLQKPAKDSSVAPDGSEVLPRHFGRYVLEALLGQGGMGRVYRAQDLRLRRRVAIKILSRDVPDLIQRFAREARSQAKIDHENVCRIFEVDEHEGIPFIAMQYLDGTPLNRALATLNFEQKIEVMRQIADGVHAAHSVGLIHRDLKPGNIIVCQNPSGGFRAHILDFGLARSLEDHQLTVVGDLLGTPAFMAPEHLDTSIGEIDRRTDIYALGATFYQLITRKLPFSSQNTGELFRKILEVEPTNPREITPSIPKDVSIIILTCLEKKPHHRYGSAKALHDDLQRFQRGEPIHARSMGFPYVVQKRIRKHPAAFLGGISVLILGLWILFSAMNSARREQVIRDFTTMAKDLEAEIRFVHLSRKHDIRPDLARLTQQLDQVETTLSNRSAIAKGPGRYALGKGYLAMGEYQRARIFLEESWDKGYQAPAVAFALCQTYLGLYRLELWKVQLIADQASRTRRMEEIRQSFRVPALHYLEKSKAAGPTSTTYLSASLAFFEGNYLQALDILQKGPAPLPWEHEILLLQGDIYKALALDWHYQGKKTKALGAVNAAKENYQMAANIAASNPLTYRSLGEAFFTQAFLGFFEAGDLESVFIDGERILDDALFVLPEDAQSLMAKARLNNLWAEYCVTRQQDPLPLATKALADAGKAAELAPSETSHFDILARAHWVKARWLHEKGQNPMSEITQSLTAMANVPEDQWDQRYFNTLGSTHLLQARYEESQGLTSANALEAAVNAYRLAIRLAPDNADGYINLGICQFKWATQQGTEKSLAIQLLTQALDILTTAKNLQGGTVLTLYYLGRTHLALTQMLQPGPDRLDHYQASKACFEEGLALNPNLANLHSCLGELAHLQALGSWLEGGQALPYFQESFRAYQTAIKVTPSYSYAYHNLGLAFLDLARLSSSNPVQNQQSLLTAKSWLERSLALRPNRESLAALAEANLQISQQKPSTTPHSNSFLTSARAQSVQLMKEHPTYSRTWYVAAMVQLAEMPPQFSSSQDVQNILASLAKALEIEPGTPMLMLVGAKLIQLAQKTASDPKRRDLLRPMNEVLLHQLGNDPSPPVTVLRTSLAAHLQNPKDGLEKRLELQQILQKFPHLQHFYFVNLGFTP